MGTFRFFFALVFISLFINAPALTVHAEPVGVTAETDAKWIINDGGVSYLPPGSLSGLALALERNGATVRVDLVLSSDNRVMVLSDVRIDRITDVADYYPERSRADGDYYAFDFSADELRCLTLLQPSENPASGNSFSPFATRVPVTTLSDFLGYLDRRYRNSEQKPTLICTLRQGWLHREEGKNLGSTVLALLDSHLSVSGSTRFYLASYDPDELQQLAEKRASAGQSGIEFMQLVGTNDGTEVRRLEFGSQQPYSYDLLFTRVGIKLVSTYASAVGLDAPVIIDAAGTVLRPRLLEDIKALGMKVICCRIDTSPYPAAVAGKGVFYEKLLFVAGFDGVVTRTDDAVRQWLDGRAAASLNKQQQTIERLIDQIEESGIQPPEPGRPDATM